MTSFRCIVVLGLFFVVAIFHKLNFFSNSQSSNSQTSNVPKSAFENEEIKEVDRERNNPPDSS